MKERTLTLRSVSWSDGLCVYVPTRTPALDIHGTTPGGKRVRVRLHLEPADVVVLREKLKIIAIRERDAWIAATV